MAVFYLGEESLGELCQQANWTVIYQAIIDKSFPNNFRTEGELAEEASLTCEILESIEHDTNVSQASQRFHRVVSLLKELNSLRQELLEVRAERDACSRTNTQEASVQKGLNQTIRELGGDEQAQILLKVSQDKRKRSARYETLGVVAFFTALFAVGIMITMTLTPLVMSILAAGALVAGTVTVGSVYSTFRYDTQATNAVNAYLELSRVIAEKDQSVERQERAVRQIQMKAREIRQYCAAEKVCEADLSRLNAEIGEKGLEGAIETRQSFEAVRVSDFSMLGTGGEGAVQAVPVLQVGFGGC